MKEFSKILERNGVKVPKKMNPSNRIQKMRVSLFDKRWDEASKLYKELRCSMHRLKGAETSLKEKWGIEASTCGPMLRFRNPQQAKKVLDRELKRFQECEDEVRDLIRSARKEWVQEIIRNAPQDTKLVVIKDNEYVPDSSNVLQFEESVKQGQPCSIAACMLVTMWVAFNPEEGEPKGIEYWAMTPKSVTVQYI